MLFVESERLKLIPLNYEQLLQVQKNNAEPDQVPDSNFLNIQIEPHFKADAYEALQNFWLPNTRAYPDLYYWYTNWQIVLKSTDTVIGGIGFGGYPDDYGETSVGYMIDIRYRRQGFATEALHTLLKWGFNFSVLKAVNADTQLKNTASKHTLLKAGFKETDRGNKLLYFKLVKTVSKRQIYNKA
jgi:ribosomal-protein-alanine N-acetyltransferase